MPERPKRRKNNKNKRKNNRNTRAEVNDNSPSPSVNVPLNDDISLVSLEDSIQVKVINEVLNSEEDNDNSPSPSVNVLLKDDLSLVSVKDSKQVNENSEVKKELFNELLENIKRVSNTEKDNVVISEEKLLDNEKPNYEEPVNNYVVESPDQPSKNKTKLSNGMKSKSVDNDDSPTIVDITDETVKQINTDYTLPFVDDNNVIISDVESDVQWQKVDDLIDIVNSASEELIEEASTIAAIPLNIAQCNQIKSLSPEDEDSLRCYLKTLNLSTNPEGLTALEINSEIEQVINREIKHRLRKKALVEDTFYQRAGPSRSLAVIDEEGSSESSMTSRRQSYLSDKKSDNDELEDEVFESKTTQFTKRKYDNTKKVNFSSRTIPQECIRVDAKLKEPEISEARGDWTTKTIEKLTGAEIVYLTDSSSSTSSIYDINDDTENGEESDISVRIITPIIEVIDTEKLLKNSFMSEPDISFNGSQKEHADPTVMSLDEKHITEQKKSEEPSCLHEIVVNSTENIKTNLFVKDITKDENYENKGDGLEKLLKSKKLSKDIDEYDLKIKVLKCELNDAFNNLITEVTSDSENTKDSGNDLLSRQDSSSSVSSSQCTAKYNPTHSSLNDVSNIIHDNHDENDILSSHVKEVLDHVPEKVTQTLLNSIVSQPQSMRDLCLQRISLLPYGDKIIEELAQVSKRLHNLTSFGTDSYLIPKENKNISVNSEQKHSDNSNKLVKKNVHLSHIQSPTVPPPVKPRKSSLKKTQEENVPGIQLNSENIFGCLSPSHKILMEKTNTVVANNEENSGHNFNEEHIKRKKSDTIVADTIKNVNVSPFKSQTGSRLLSLICDTSLKNNVNSVLIKSLNKGLDELSKDNTDPLKFLNHETKIGYPPHRTNASASSSTFTSISPFKPSLFSSSFYDSDTTSEFTEKSHKTTKNEKKYFHFSTGNLSKDIEDDVSCIQNMHRYYTNMRDAHSHEISPRRPSLPKDLCDQQMEYIRQKEQEVDAEIRRLEKEKPIIVAKKGPRAPMLQERDVFLESTFSSCNSKISKGEYFPTKAAKFKNSLFSSSEEELLREKMYSEYVNQMAEREFRKEQKIIKITKPSTSKVTSKSMPMIDMLSSKVNNRIEREFITKARERWDKLGIRDPETEVERSLCCDMYSEPKVIEHKIKVLEAGEEKDVTNLPNHLQEFVKFTVKEKDQETGDTGESEPEKPSAHVVVLCAVIILMMTVGKYFLRLLRNN